MNVPTPTDIHEMSIHSGQAVDMAVAFLTAEGMQVERVPGLGMEHSSFRLHLPFGHHTTVAGREVVYRAKRRAAALVGGAAPPDVRAHQKPKGFSRTKKSRAK